MQLSDLLLKIINFFFFLFKLLLGFIKLFPKRANLKLELGHVCLNARQLLGSERAKVPLLTPVRPWGASGSSD